LVYALFSLSRLGLWKPHGFNPGLFVMKPASFGHGCHFPTWNYGVTMATRNELRNCYGCVKEMPRIVHGLLRLCYEFATISPEVTR